MEFTKTDFEGLWLINPKVFSDRRGFFLEFYSRKPFEARGIDVDFVQDNHSKSYPRGVIRGLHCQLPPFEQAKLVRVTRGAAMDVIVDLRRASPTFGLWRSFELTEGNFQMLFVPRGCAHGFCTTEPDTEFMYKVDNLYSPAHDTGIRWNDPDLSVSWPIKDPVVSDKDAGLPLFADFRSPF